MSRRTHLAVALAAAISFLAPPALANGLGGGSDHTARMSPGIANALAVNAPATKVVAFVSVTEGLDAAAVLATSGLGDVTVINNYPLVSAASVVTSTRTLDQLAHHPDVVYLQHNGKLELADDATSWATRVRVAQENLAGGPYTDGSGNVLNGAGIGVAVPDSGFFPHPDIKDRVARSFKYVCATLGEVDANGDPVRETCLGNPILDETLGDGTPRYGWVEAPLDQQLVTDEIGHGTTIAGVIAGEGTMSTGSYAPGTGPNLKGTFTGVAPGTTLYTFNGVPSFTMYDLNINETYYYILSHLDEFNPAIRIVNNSFDDRADPIPFDPDSVRSRMTDALVDAGLVMVFAAGNHAGDGTTDRTSSMCDNPKPGVICVANYDESTIPGDRDGTIRSTSARGLASDTANTLSWPDISAPGSRVLVPCMRAIQAQCQNGGSQELRWDGWYHDYATGEGQSGGTSLSAAHVSGAIAMLLQASPSLTPAQVEDRLQDNAYKFTSGASYASDPQNSGGTTSYDKGAGLLDLKATLDSLSVSHATATAASNYELIGGEGGDFPRSGADIVSLKVTQATGSSGAAGFRYALETAGIDFSLPVTGAATYRLWQTIDGKEYMTSIDAHVGGAFPGAGTLPAVTSPAEDVSRTGNVVSFFVPFSKLGNVPAGEPIFQVRVSSGAIPLVQLACVNVNDWDAICPPTYDVAPGGTEAAVTSSLRPMYGRPYARV